MCDLQFNEAFGDSQNQNWNDKHRGCSEAYPAVKMFLCQKIDQLYSAVNRLSFRILTINTDSSLMSRGKTDYKDQTCVLIQGIHSVAYNETRGLLNHLKTLNRLLLNRESLFDEERSPILKSCAAVCVYICTCASVGVMICTEENMHNIIRRFFYWVIIKL